MYPLVSPAVQICHHFLVHTLSFEALIFCRHCSNKEVVPDPKDRAR